MGLKQSKNPNPQTTATALFRKFELHDTMGKSLIPTSLPSAPQGTSGWFDHCGLQLENRRAMKSKMREVFSGQDAILFLLTRGKQKLVHKRGNTMRTVISKDGTPIAFDQSGQGPLLILVAGALCARLSWSGPQLATLLAPHFTVYNYDRRGRGDSGDTKPYAVTREVEDLEVLIDEAGESAYLYGHSSGGALILEAALQLGEKVKKLAIYEVPYHDDREARRAWRAYIQRLTELLAADRRGDAVALFMELSGTPAEQIAAMRHSATWPLLEAIAPTLAYDHAAILGQDLSVPIERVAQVRVPTLIMNGSASYPFLSETARTLSQAMPHALLSTLQGQGHVPANDVLAPALKVFFLG
jgi:pimeloyl-ACP methyl ester carboxylesterase